MRTERWLLVLAVTAVAVVAGLWLVGPWKALPQRAWGVLLALAAGAGLTSLAAGLVLREASTASRCAAAGAGLATLAATAGFVAAVLWNRPGPVPIDHRGQPPAAPAAEPPGRLRLVSWNVLHGYPGFAYQGERARRLTATLRSLNPDLVILQEAWWAAGQGHFAHDLAAALGMSVTYARANGSRGRIGFEEGSAILSRFPLRSARRVVLRPREPFWHTRIALSGQVELGGTESLGVVGVHLERDGDRTRRLQVEHLRRLLPTAPPFLVAGDLNAPAGSPEVQALRRGGLQVAVSTARDHILVAPGDTWRLARAEALPAPMVDGLALSDHPLLLVELERVVEL